MELTTALFIKTQYESEKPRAVRLREEQLDITKERVQVGELQLHKEVVEEQRTVHVPLIREEVYVERRPVIDGKYDGSPFTEDEIIRIPITEERIEVTKRPVVVEEVIIGKRKIQETKQVQDTIRKEEARIERSVSLRQWTTGKLDYSIDPCRARRSYYGKPKYFDRGRKSRYCKHNGRGSKRKKPAENAQAPSLYKERKTNQNHLSVKRTK